MDLSEDLGHNISSLRLNLSHTVCHLLASLLQDSHDIEGCTSSHADQQHFHWPHPQIATAGIRRAIEDHGMPAAGLTHEADILNPFDTRLHADLLDVQQFDIEYQGRIRRDHTTRATSPITHLRWDHQCTLTAYLHAGKSLIPTLDHLTTAKIENEGLTTIHGAVELLPLILRFGRIIQPAGVMYGDVKADLGFAPATFKCVDFDEFGYRLGHGIPFLIHGC